MDSDKRKVKQIAGLIVFTMLVYTIFINYEKVFAGIEFLWDLIFPFVLGGAIAFLTNVPMSFLEKKIFENVKKKNTKKPIFSVIISV